MIKDSIYKIQSIFELVNLSLAKLDSPEQIQLMHLWQNWSVVMGSELESLVYPLGHKNTVLIVGGEDSVSLQEISMQRSEILERVNAFMEKDFFADINIRLLFGKTPLSVLVFQNTNAIKHIKTAHIPLATGKYLKSMDMNSPVARCYEKFSK